MPLFGNDAQYIIYTVFLLLVGYASTAIKQMKSIFFLQVAEILGNLDMH